MKHTCQFMEDLRVQMKAYRKAKGITQCALANRIGVPQQVINRFENESYYNPSIDTVVKILEGMKMKLEIKIKGRK